MDTDDLSTEAYEGIIIAADKFNHDLMLEFAVLASACYNEILLQAKKHSTQPLKKYSIIFRRLKKFR